jgi:hypothetical protein
VPPIAKRKKAGEALVLSDLGFQAHVFDHDDVLCLLRAAVEREGSQTAFAKHHGLERTQLNETLKGKRAVSISQAKALRLRKVYIAE